MKMDTLWDIFTETIFFQVFCIQWLYHTCACTFVWVYTCIYIYACVYTYTNMYLYTESQLASTFSSFKSNAWHCMFQGARLGSPETQITLSCSAIMTSYSSVYSGHMTHLCRPSASRYGTVWKLNQKWKAMFHLSNPYHTDYKVFTEMSLSVTTSP